MGSKGSASKNSSHLSDEQLAQFQDGELSGSEASHLESCSHCGSRLQDLHAAAMVYLEYQDSIRRPLLPPAPKPWPSLSALIARHEESHPLRALRWRPAMALAAAACLVATLLVLYKVLPSRLMEQSSIRANELLTQSARVRVAKGPPDFHAGTWPNFDPAGSTHDGYPVGERTWDLRCPDGLCRGSLQLARAVKRALVSGVAQWTKE